VENPGLGRNGKLDPMVLLMQAAGPCVEIARILMHSGLTWHNSCV